MTEITEKIFKDFFRDKNGETVLYQRPNKSLIIFVLAVIVTFFTTGAIEVLFEVIAGISIAFWAYQEITTGINLFRRALGWLVAGLLILTALIAIFQNL